MGHTFSSHLFHIIFSTKQRIPLIIEDIEDLYKYMCGIARNLDAKILCIGGDKDHIHLLTKLKPTIYVADFVRTIKTNTSRWLRKSINRLRLFEWQAGYSSFSVSESKSRAVIEYIEKQKEHHVKHSFPEELMKLLKKHGVEFDPQHYLD